MASSSFPAGARGRAVLGRSYWFRLQREQHLQVEELLERDPPARRVQLLTGLGEVDPAVRLEPIGDPLGARRISSGRNSASSA